MSKYAIKLVEGKYTWYGLIYSVIQIELETLKTYIETQLKTGFSRPSKLLTGLAILFHKGFDGSLQLCINY